MPDVLPIRSSNAPQDRRRLESWKEIAAYLNVTIRTLQLWEKQKSLPVHRMGRRVFAYSDELDLWLDGAEKLIESAPEDAGTGRIWPRIAIVSGILVPLAIVCVFLLFRPGPPDHCTVDDQEFRVFDKENKTIFGHEMTDVRKGYYSVKDRSHYLIVNPGRRWDSRVLFNQVAGGPWEAASRLNGKLICFNGGGRKLWEFTYGRKTVLQGRPYDGSYFGGVLKTVEVEGKTRLLAVARHEEFSPTQVVLLEMDSGRIISEYWHPGGLAACLVLDVDGDGHQEAILGGVNNPGPGMGHAAVVVLKLPFHRAAPLPPPATPEEEDFRHFSGAQEWRYLLFPVPDIGRKLNVLPRIFEIIPVGEGQILFKAMAVEDLTFIGYYMNYDLQVVSMQESDGINGWHTRLEMQRVLDHRISDQERASWRNVLSFPTAPNGNNPEITRALAGP